MSKTQTAPYSLRLDPETKLKAEKQAKKERRSFNSWLQIAAEERLERIEKGEAA